MRTQDVTNDIFYEMKRWNDKICVKNFHVNATDVKKNT